MAEAEVAKDVVSATGTRTAADYREVADALRNRVDLFGKTLAGLATVGTGAVGLAKLGDMVPEDAGANVGGIALAVAGLLFAAFGAISIAVLLMKAGDAAVVEVEKLGLSSTEQDLIDPIFTATAQRFGLATLGALAEKEISLRRSGTRTLDSDTRKIRDAQALEIRTEIELALARSQVAVVRNRASSAVSGRLAKWCYGLVAVGLVAFALSADASTQDRAERIATGKACAEARKAGAIGVDLDGTGCAVAAPTTPETPTDSSSEELRADLVQQLGTLLVVCEKGASSTPQTSPGGTAFGARDCQAIEEAISSVLND